FRQIFEEAPSISSLAEFIDGKLPPDALPAPQRPAAPKPTVASGPTTASPGAAVPAEPPAAVAPPATAASTGAGAPSNADGMEPASAVERLIREQLRV